MRINYSLNENNTIQSYTTFPFDESKPSIEVEDVSSIVLGKTTIVNGQVINPTICGAAREKLEIELAAIRSWFADNDWKVNKIILGEWLEDDARWSAYLQERAEKRRRQDEINELLM